MKGRTPIVMVTAPGRPTCRVRIGLWLVLILATVTGVSAAGFSVGWALTGSPSVGEGQAAR